jgi:hypothetical protein
MRGKGRGERAIRCGTLFESVLGREDLSRYLSSLGMREKVRGGVVGAVVRFSRPR